MLEATRLAWEKFGWYIGESWQYALFLLALLYLLISKKEKEYKKLLIGYSVVFVLIYFCPVTAKIIMKYCTGESVYWRMLWMLPIPLVLGYVCTKIWRCQQSTVRQFFCMVLLAGLIAVSGQSVYGADTPYEKAATPYKIPPQVCWVSDAILENWDGEGKPGVAAPDELAGYIRQYNAGIRLMFGRNGGENKRRRWVARQMREEQPDFAKIAKLIRKTKIQFLVYAADESQDEWIRSLGYEVVQTVEPYIIYRDTTM